MGGGKFALKFTLNQSVMKKILIIAAAAFALIGCNKITDNPSISFNEEVYTVAASGGELIIPVNSTGIDNVNIYYQRDGEHWQVDPETGDRIPVDGWLKLTKLIENYSVTRELAQWTSGLQLAVEPNTTGVERTAYVTVRSFNLEKTVTVKQNF